MDGEIPVSGRAAVLTVVVDADTSRVGDVRRVEEVGALDAQGADTGGVAERGAVRDTVLRHPCQLLALLHERESPVGTDHDLAHEQPAEVGTERGVAVRLDDAFERVAVLPGDGYRRLRAELLLGGDAPGQHQVLLHGLPGERRVEQHGVAAEEPVDKARGVVLPDFYKGGELARDGVRRVGNRRAARAQVAGAAPFVHLVGVDHRLVAVDLVDVIGIDGIRGSLETADLAAEPDVTGRDARPVRLAARDDEIRTAVEDGAQAQRELLQVQDVVRVGISSAGFGYIFFHDLCVGIGFVLFFINLYKVGLARDPVTVHRERQHVDELPGRYRYRRHADHEADLVHDFLLGEPVKGARALRLVRGRDLLAVEPEGAGTLIFGLLVVEVHAEALAVPDEDAVPAVFQVLAEAVVQVPLEVDDLRGHAGLDVPLAGEGAEPFVQALQRVEAALHEEDETSSRQIVRHELVHQTVYGKFIPHGSRF